MGERKHFRSGRQGRQGRNGQSTYGEELEVKEFETVFLCAIGKLVEITLKRLE